MPRDYFSILGLAPTRYEPRRVAAQFFERRERLLAALGRPETQLAARRALDELHVAYALLRSPQGQEQALRSSAPAVEDRAGRAAAMQQFIAAALEDGLLRRSRREQVMHEGRRLGFSDFHTQLLIAQTQFGDTPLPCSAPFRPRAAAGPPDRAAARLAAAAVLALALLLALLRYLGV